MVEALFAGAAEFGWALQAWAVLPNHYRFIATSPTDPSSLGRFLGKLHTVKSFKIDKLKVPDDF